MDIKVVDQAGQEVNETPREAGTPGTSGVDGELLNMQIGSLFDLTTGELSQYKSKINTLLDYAKSQTEDHSVENLKWVLRDLSFRIGTPPLGEKSINHMVRYAHLRLNRDQINKELDKFENPSKGK